MSEPLVLDRYRLQKRIALGGSAEVWRARDQTNGGAVAVKRLHAHLLPDAASRRRLAAEARAASGLTHPGIVKIYDVDADGEVPALVMELVDGESLAARLDRDGPLPADDAVRVAAEMADALYHAHQQGIVHRDVKPGNILLGRDGRARLVDFGIARSLADAAERTTVAGSVIGTPRYMAPEQLRDGFIGPRTDLFGLGLVLHEMLTGRSPFRATTPVGLADEQAAGSPTIQGIEPSLAAIISACLAPDPANRPLHAGALAESLRGWLAAAAVPAAIGAVDPAAVTQPMVAVASLLPEPPLLTAPVPRRSHRPLARAERAQRRLPVALSVALAGIALVGVMALALANPTQEAAFTAPSIAPTATPTVAPEPTPPAWLAGLMGEYAAACGPDGAVQLAATLAATDEEAAADQVEELIDACGDEKKDKDRDRGNGGD